MEKRYKLNIVGITQSANKSGLYSIIFEQENSNRRVSILIGIPEAQSIECKLQEVIPPRPLTHDMATGILESFGITLLEVEIRRLENGVYAAYMLLSNGEKTVKLDSRSSDAIAMAVRANAPIYASESFLEKEGFVNESGQNQMPTKKRAETDLTKMSEQMLKREMQIAVEQENYEKAALIKEELQKRKPQD